MKRVMSFFLIVALLSLWVPCSSAEEVAQDLDPMVSPDVQATVVSEGSASDLEADQADNTVSIADAPREEKKVEKKKKNKSKKSSKKKSSEKKKKKSSGKSSKKQKKSSN